MTENLIYASCYLTYMPKVYIYFNTCDRKGANGLDVLMMDYASAKRFVKQIEEGKQIVKVSGGESSYVEKGDSKLIVYDQYYCMNNIIKVNVDWE